MPEIRFASCSRGAIRLAARGQPLRVGLCHCTTCRKECGTPFTANAIFRTGDVIVQGDLASWKDSTDVRHFCPSCGSTVFGVSDGTGEFEIRLSAFDVAPTNLVPTYELWVCRRERCRRCCKMRRSSPATRRDLHAVGPDRRPMAGAYSSTNLAYCRVLMRFADSLNASGRIQRAVA